MKTNFTKLIKDGSIKTIAIALFLFQTMISNGQYCQSLSSPQNLIKNPSFEVNTDYWAATNGDVYAGSGYVICGSQNGYLYSYNNGSPSSAYTEVTPLLPGTKLNLQGYFGTHNAGQSCSPIIRVAYYDNNWNFISADQKSVTTSVDVAPYMPALYTINSIVPANTAHTRFETIISCDYVKIDAVLMTISSASPLPIKLSAFTANLNNDKSELRWSAESEIDASHYVVERSVNGKTYSDIATVSANGNTKNKMEYAYSDNISNLKAEVIYYRLRLVDIDGKTDYSPVRIIRAAKQNEMNVFAYPNPAGGELKITVPQTMQGKELKIELYNGSGQLIKSKKAVIASQIETISTSDLKVGFYVLRIATDTERFQSKIIKN
jgi:hypothetical protein